jgi:hypothetical protein
MGKQIIYEKRPNGPRSAKIAWSDFTKLHGKEPLSMRLDSQTREWVAIYENAGSVVERRKAADEAA